MTWTTYTIENLHELAEIFREKQRYAEELANFVEQKSLKSEYEAQAAIWELAANIVDRTTLKPKVEP